jgi:CheY-like chemotaxis protein
MRTRRGRAGIENERTTILVVDDGRKIAGMIVHILTAAGYRAIAVDTGGDALALEQRERPDVVISDLRMIGMSGHQLQAEIKAARARPAGRC